ncbi:MAG: cupredoxin domain-containing protein [Solirubrobacteraceae bacterium]
MHRLPAVLALAALVGAGCGGGSGGASAEKTAAPPKSQAPAGASGGGGKAVKKVSESIKDFEFVPRTTTVAAGGEVTWTNTDAANHTVTFDMGGPKGVANLRKGQKGTVTFDKPGSYAYVCQYHPNMHGTVVVK